MSAAYRELTRALDFRAHVVVRPLSSVRSPKEEPQFALYYPTSVLRSALENVALDTLKLPERVWVARAVARMLRLDGKSVPNSVAVPGTLRLDHGKKLRAFVNVETIPVVDALERYVQREVDLETNRADALVQHLVQMQERHGLLSGAVNEPAEALTEATLEVLRSPELKSLSRLQLVDTVVAQALVGWAAGEAPSEIQALAEELVRRTGREDVRSLAWRLTAALGSVLPESHSVEDRFRLVGALEELDAALIRLETAAGGKAPRSLDEQWELFDAHLGIDRALRLLEPRREQQIELTGLMDEAHRLHERVRALACVPPSDE